MNKTTDAYITIESLYKVFGIEKSQYARNHSNLIQTLESGISKEALLEESGCILGLNDINLSINQGETFVIMGLSGSGKSTLIRHFNLLNRPTFAKTLSIAGHDCLTMNTHSLQQFRAHQISMVFQNFALFPNLSVIDNVAYGLKIQGLNKQQRHHQAQAWIEKIGLAGFEDKKPSQLSGGMQQRVGSARAFATNADILLMDEPFSALDPIIRKQMQDELKNIKKTDQRTIIFITHDLDEALHLGDRIAILDAGKIIQLGEPKSILTNPANQHIKKFIAGVNRLQIMTASDVAIDCPPELITTTDQINQRKTSEQTKSFTFVVDQQQIYQGIIHPNQSKPESKQTHQHPTPAANASQSLESLLPLVTLTDHPIALINKQGRIKGQITKHSVLKALAATQQASAL